MANHRRVSAQQEQEIQKLYNDGHAATVIARTIDIPADTVRRTMVRMGLEVRRSGRRSGLMMEQIEEIVRAYASGENTRKISKRYGVTDQTIARIVREAGVELRPAGFQTGPAHHGWNGGVTTNSSGYVMERVYPDDPFFGMAIEKASGASYAPQHRLVMARNLGRALEEHETVHHIDGDKSNNSIENLQLRFGKHGKGVILQCVDCGSRNIEHKPLH